MAVMPPLMQAPAETVQYLCSFCGAGVWYGVVVVRDVTAMCDGEFIALGKVAPLCSVLGRRTGPLCPASAVDRRGRVWEG